LLSEVPQYKEMEIPKDTEKQKRLLRSLMNIRPPRSISSEFLKVQDEYLSKEVEEKGIILEDPKPDDGTIILDWDDYGVTWE